LLAFLPRFPFLRGRGFFNVADQPRYKTRFVREMKSEANFAVKLRSLFAKTPLVFYTRIIEKKQIVM
jgi:hypothetical protein